MHISKKLKSVLARAPVLLALALIFTVGHPVRAQAKTVVSLEEDMEYFVTFTTGKQSSSVIETKGETLEEMFPGTNFKDKSQYFAYYKLDTKASTDWTWETAIEYWHKSEFKTDKYDNIWVPQKDLKKKGVFFKVDVKHGNSGTGCGKKSFTKYKTSLKGTWKQVPSGMRGTLHYFCIDDGTVAGNALNQLKKEQQSKDNKVRFYVSPVIHNSAGCDHYDLNSWYTNTVRGSKYYWKDRNKANYKAHYNIEYIIEIPTVKITQNASLIGKRMKTSDAFKVQDKLSYSSKDVDHVRSLIASDYFFRPKFKDTRDGKEQVLLKVKDSKGKTMENPTVDYVPYEDEKSGNKADPVKLNSPVATKNTKDPTITYTEGGKQKSAVLVGFTAYKKVDTNEDGKADEKIFLSNCMIKMKKDETGQYRPYYVEETAKNAMQEPLDEVDHEDDDVAGSTGDDNTNNEAAIIKEDTDKDGETVAVPANVLDRHVTGMKYKKFTKKGNKIQAPNTENLTLRDWVNDMNGYKDSRKAYWLMIKKLGIRNKDRDTTTEIVVDWLYAPVDSPPTVILEQYYVDYNKGSGEKLRYETGEFPDVDNSGDLSYNHRDINQVVPTLEHRTELEQVNYGDPWVSYSVKRDKHGAYKLRDGTVYPVQDDMEDAKAQSGLSTKFKNTKPKKVIKKSNLIPNRTYTGSDGREYEQSYIPYFFKGSDPHINKYLYEVRIKTEYDGKWTKFTASDIWGDDYTIANGKLTSDRGYLTNAPYMKRYMWGINYSIKDQSGNIKCTEADWQKDAYNMTHFIIPECRGNIVVQAYYTSTVPIRVMTYVGNEAKGYSMVDFQQHWYTPGQNFHGTFPMSGDQKIAAIFCASGDKAYSKPYAVHYRRKDSFKSVHQAELYYPERSDINAASSSFDVKVPAEPIAIIIMLSDTEPYSRYFTQVQYVHTQDGQYHFIKAWQQEIKTLKMGETIPHHVGYDRYGNPIYSTFWHGSNTVRAFVSFPQYVSYDDGHTGLYGSLYKETGVYYEYSDYKNFPPVTGNRPGKYFVENNFSKGIYLTQKGHDKFESCGDYDITDYAVRNPAGGDNSLICYCIYEDIYDTWQNEQFNPETKGDNPKREEEQSIYWNWLLPNGFVWESVDIESKDTVDITQYGKEYSNPFIAQVMGTNDSAAFDAQQGIPTTDFVRTQAQVPRYETKGYYNKEMIDWAYRIYAVYVKQHKVTKTIMSGNNDPDDNVHQDTPCIPHHGPIKSYCTFDYYTSEPVQQDKNLVVERHGVYYKLGDAEVWDPYKVTMKNDVFCNTSISKNGLVTMYGYGAKGGYASNARFFKLSDGSYKLPDLTVVRQYVNYGTYNDWSDAMDVLSDLENFPCEALPKTVTVHMPVNCNLFSSSPLTSRKYFLNTGSCYDRIIEKQNHLIYMRRKPCIMGNIFPESERWMHIWKERSHAFKFQNYN